MTDKNEQRRLLRERGICVVIPTYNNGTTIADVVRAVKDECDDVIVVDDGCTDTTAQTLSAIGGITVVSYGRNRGKGYALKRGLREALRQGFAYAITLDADGQHYPSDIAAFLAANQEHPGALLLGRRCLDGVERSKGAAFANKFSNFWFRLQTGINAPDTQTGYRLYPLRRLHGLALLTARYEAELELIVLAAWHDVKLVSLPVRVYYPPREQRVSHFRPAADFLRITVLNCVLCVLAIIYGLPLRLWRWLMKWGRTLYALLFFLLACLCVLTPWAWLYTRFGPMTERKRMTLHRAIRRMARFVMLRHGIPGVKFTREVDERADFDRPSVIICNHQSQLDLMPLLIFSPKIIFLTNDWVYRNPLFGYLIRHAEYLPVHDGIDALLPHLRSLKERGYSIAVFPEGTRSPDGRIGRFHQGAFYIAQQLQLPVQPMILYGANRVLKKKTYHLNRGHIHLEVGPPIEQPELQALGGLRQQASALRQRYRQWFASISNRIERSGYSFMLALALMALAPLFAHAQENIWAGEAGKPRVELTPYIATGGTGTGVIVCPGGSYFWHDMQTEGHAVARWLQQNGISAFVLKYRTAQFPAYFTHFRWLIRGRRYPDAQDDLRQALRFVKSRAATYGVDTTRIGAMGFSAGGHLVMSAAELFAPQERPAFVVPVYPVVTMLEPWVHKRSRRALLGDNRVGNRALRDSLSLERHVPDDCPPVFLVNCIDDPTVDYHNSVVLDSALTAKRIPHEYLQYRTGGHGFGASDTKGTDECRRWRTAFLRWLRALYPQTEPKHTK